MWRDNRAMFEADPMIFLLLFVNQDLGLPLPTREERTIETVETPTDSGSQERQIGEVHREGDGLGFLGCKQKAVLLVDYLKRVTGLQEPIGLISWDTYRRKSRRFGLGSWQERCSSTRTMLQSTVVLADSNVEHPPYSPDLPPSDYYWMSSPGWRRSSVVTILLFWQWWWCYHRWWPLSGGSRCWILQQRDPYAPRVLIPSAMNLSITLHSLFLGCPGQFLLALVRGLWYKHLMQSLIWYLYLHIEL